MSARTLRRGFTLVELLLAVGLLSILILALLRLVDTSLTIWGRTDDNRELSEMSSAVMELLAADIQALEPGARGDILADWSLQDLDRDGIAGAPRQRLRLVRNVTAAELQLLTGAQLGRSLETFERGLVEVAWAVERGGNEADLRSQGTLMRGMRLLDDADTLSFFDPGFFGPGGKTPPGSLHELTGGVLWFDLWFATQTSILREGWKLGDGLSACATSWDAWGRDRPDTTVSALNQPASGMPAAGRAPLVPRRVRIELELERPSDLRQRTRLAQELPEEGSTLVVRDGRKLPERGELVLIDEEWLKILAVDGERVSVERGRRSTRPAAHPVDALVHHGWRTTREVVVNMTREDWNL